MLYGWQVLPDTSQPRIRLLEENLEELLKSLGVSNSLIDAFPALLYLPKAISKWKRLGSYWYHRHMHMFEGLLDEVRQQPAEVRTFMLAAGCATGTDLFSPKGSQMLCDKGFVES